MAKLSILGGKRLKGTITPHGAKNEALQVIAACLLTEDPVRLDNLPRIDDVLNLLRMVEMLGARVEWADEHCCTICARNVSAEALHDPSYAAVASQLRGSVLLVGPMLARFGEAYVATPGGDKIGRRRLDTHLLGLQALGATLSHSSSNGGGYWLRASRLQGSYMLLDEASVTGTASIVMAATAAHGKTTIFNAACEPYVQQLCRLLQAMGVKIEGLGSNLLSVYGPNQLHGATHRLLPDMIEVGSFIGLAALTQSEITIAHCGYEHLGIIPTQFARLGIALERRDDNIYIPPDQNYTVETFIDGSIMTISDAPWPGLTPDLISVLLVVATQATGAVLIHQKMFESRLFFVDRLIEMGAQIILCDPHRATVIGLGHRVPLHGAKLVSPDIRAGVALLIAALAAQGPSEIDNAEQIDRGYENIEGRLIALGADIARLPS